MFSKKFNLLIGIVVGLFAILFFFRQEASAASAPISGSASPLHFKHLATSALSMQNPQIEVMLDLNEAATLNSLQLELHYQHFDQSKVEEKWGDSDSLVVEESTNYLGSYALNLSANNGAQTISVTIPPQDIAVLKKYPALLKGEIVAADGRPVSNSAIGLYLGEKLDLIHVSALAFDNPMYSGGNIAPQIRESILGLQKASQNQPNVLSVVLADSYGDGDSQIYFVFQNAIVSAKTLFSGLPNSSGVLTPSINEYDMGNGETLGGLLMWARSLSPEQRLNFSYYGHGSAIMPTINAEKGESSSESESSGGSGPITMPSWVHVQPSWVHVQPSWVHVQPSWVHVQPSWVHVQPSWVHVQPTWVIEEEHFATDSHPLSLISVKDIARAAELGSNNGKNPLAVIDLVHCFSLSIEQAHEIAPYTEAIIGSANYHFFDARMPGNALADLNPQAGSLALADDIMHSYEATLPREGYPRTMAVLDASEIRDIKTHWDDTSAALLDAFSQDHTGTRERLQAAYTNATKYDSTSCDNEFSLKSPDALVDFYELASQIESRFADDSSVAAAAGLTSAQIDAAVYSTINHSGNPWFGTSENDHWNFNGKGLSIFADLQGMPDPHSRSAAVSWQTAFYNRLPTDIHLTPFEFLASENDAATWADVIQTAWEGYEVYPQSCLITIPPDHDEVEVTLNTIRLKSAEKGDRKASAEFVTSAPLGNLILHFELVQNEEVVFSETVYSGWLDAGTHEIMTSSEISKELLAYDRENRNSLRVTLDPSGYLIETTTDDNQLELAINR